MASIDLTLDQLIEKGKNILKEQEEEGGKFKSASGKTIAIGPLVANANFSDISRPDLTATTKFASGAVTLPETWSWRPDQIDPKYDTGARLDAKRNISPVLYQALCGSCWAFALASAINDCFIVSGKYLQLPSGAGKTPTSAISPTALLSCVRDEYCKACEGGNPGWAAEVVQSKGVFSSTCLDYSWILDNKVFSGDALSHFNSPAAMTKAMNDALPNCGCLAEADTRKKFTITDVHTLPAALRADTDTTTPTSLRNTWDNVRRWIWENGSVVACYVIFKNFLNKNDGGRFAPTNGVYFEDYPYGGDGKEYSGLHAVRVLGWGVEKNCTLPGGGKADVPYWVAGNSWGEDWGDKGYFKIARYPYNKVAQFDTLINIQGGTIGGFVLFKAGEITEANIPLVQSQFQTSAPNPQRKSAGFYKSEIKVDSVPPVTPSQPRKDQNDVIEVISNLFGGNGGEMSEETKKKLEIGLWIVIAAIVAFGIYKFMKKRGITLGSVFGQGGGYGGGSAYGGSKGAFGMHKLRMGLIKGLRK